MTELIPMSENDGQQQEQDLAERDERLMEVLNIIYTEAKTFPLTTEWTMEDIDFIATCSGVADYRKT